MANAGGPRVGDVVGVILRAGAEAEDAGRVRGGRITGGQDDVAGADGVAVISEILGATNPAESARRLWGALQ